MRGRNDATALSGRIISTAEAELLGNTWYNDRYFEFEFLTQRSVCAVQIMTRC